MLYDAVVILAVLMLATAVALALGTGQRTAGHDPLYTVYLVAAWFGYLSACWRRGMTLGMRAWRLRVETRDGAALDWQRAALRFAASFLAWIPLGLGVLWMLIDPDKLGWHDRLSGTRVVLLPRKPKKPRR